MDTCIFIWIEWQWYKLVAQGPHVQNKNADELWVKTGPIQSELLWFLMYENVRRAPQGLTNLAQSTGVVHESIR